MDILKGLVKCVLGVVFILLMSIPNPNARFEIYKRGGIFKGYSLRCNDHTLSVGVIGGSVYAFNYELLCSEKFQFYTKVWTKRYLVELSKQGKLKVEIKG